MNILYKPKKYNKKGEVEKAELKAVSWSAKPDLEKIIKQASKRKKIRKILFSILIVFFVVMLLGCSSVESLSTFKHQYLGDVKSKSVYRFDDEGVRCYISSGIKATSISCLKF